MPSAAGADYDPRVRVVAFDYGRARIGVATSDPSGVLARPLTTFAAGRADTLDQAVSLLSEISGEDGGLDAIVVGLPRRLDGGPHDLADEVRAFAAALAERVKVPVVLQDERLSSHEADSRLAATERSWRRRKAKLDAAAAAVVLQDYLDARDAAHGG